MIERVAKTWKRMVALHCGVSATLVGGRIDARLTVGGGVVALSLIVVRVWPTVDGIEMVCFVV